MQTIKKVIKKIGAISVGTAFMGASILGAMAQNLADYPEPFVTGGSAVGSAIIYASTDATAAQYIQNGLAGVVTETGGTTTVSFNCDSTTEDCYKAEKASNKFNLNDSMDLMDNKLDKNDLPVMLADGTFKDKKGTNKGDTDFNQYLKFRTRASATDPTFALVYDARSENPDDGLKGSRIIWKCRPFSFPSRMRVWF